MAWALIGVVIVAAGLAWCHFYPSERDRFAHTFYGWVAMGVISLVLGVTKHFFPGLY